MRLRLLTAAALLLASGFLTGFLATGTASAAPSRPQEHTNALNVNNDLKKKVKHLLKVYPGSHQINATTVRIRDGVNVAVTPSRSGSRPVTAAATCEYGWLCLWQDANAGGYELYFTLCQFVNLGELPFPDGGYWNDRISSWINDQTPGTDATFFNWVGYWDDVYDSYAPHAVANLKWLGINDIIDAVQVC